MYRKVLAAGLASAALALLAGCGQKSDADLAAEQAARIADARAQTEAALADPTKAEGFVNLFAIGDMFEIESSQVALARTKSPAIRTLAETLIADHTASTAQLRQLIDGGEVDGPSLPSALDGTHQSLLGAVRSAGPDDFDGVFLDLQAGAHRDALARLKAYEAVGDVGRLKSLAQDALPKVQAHLDTITALQRANSGS